MTPGPAVDLCFDPRVSSWRFRPGKPRRICQATELRSAGCLEAPRIQCNSVPTADEEPEATTEARASCRGLIPRGPKIAAKDVILSPDIDLCGVNQRNKPEFVNMTCSSLMGRFDHKGINIGILTKPLKLEGPKRCGRLR